MIARIRAFGAFWYDFIIGDDWRIALGVAVMLAVTWAVSHTAVPSWWLLPVAVVALVPLSLWKATRTR
jgi:hypothetical protein